MSGCMASACFGEIHLGEEAANMSVTAAMFEHARNTEGMQLWEMLILDISHTQHRVLLLKLAVDCCVLSERFLNLRERFVKLKGQLRCIKYLPPNHLNLTGASNTVDKP